VEQAADARTVPHGNAAGRRPGATAKTKLLREIAMHHLQVGKLEARLKQLLNRSQESPDIEPADLTEHLSPNLWRSSWPRASTESGNR